MDFALEYKSLAVKLEPQQTFIPLNHDGDRCEAIKIGRYYGV